MSNELIAIDKQIQAIKNSPEYRRLLTAARGDREARELSHFNIQITTLEYRKKELEEKCKPSTAIQGAIKMPSSKSKMSHSVTKPVVRENPQAQAQRRILTFAPNRPRNLKSPTGPQDRVLTPDSMPNGTCKVPETVTMDDLDEEYHPPPPEVKKPTRAKLRNPRNTKAPPKTNVSVLRDNIRDLEAELEDLTEEV